MAFKMNDFLVVINNYFFNIFHKKPKVNFLIYPIRALGNCNF